jgi:hypothetical protein
LKAHSPTSRAFTAYRATINASSAVNAAKYHEVMAANAAAMR